MSKKPTNHSDRDHAKFAPSAAARWLLCHGSIKLSEGIESKSSSYAEEGTECHEASADILMGAPWDKTIANLSDEQIDIVAEYTNYCFDLIDRLTDKYKDIQVWIEERVRAPQLHPDYHGTGDFAILAGRTLGVVDLKAGYTPVIIRDPLTGKINPQLASYALLNMHEHNLWKRVDKIRLTIVQPRVYSKPQTVVITYADLIEFEDIVDEALVAIDNGSETLVAGSHCKYCPARGRCPELRRQAIEKARIIFDNPRAPHLYPPEELEAILDEAEMMEAHINGIRAHIIRELQKGRKYQNWKLVQKRATSKWTDFDAVLNGLIPEYDIGWNECHNTKPKSPAQLKKELKKRGIEFDLTDYFVKESSGTTLARMDDSREAVKYDAFPDEEE